MGLKFRSFFGEYTVLTNEVIKLKLRVLKLELSEEYPCEIAIEHYHNRPIESLEALTFFGP